MRMRHDRRVLWVVLGILMILVFTGCGSGKKSSQPEDGTYTVEVTMDGGSGRAYVESPAQITVKDGAVTARIVWSSSNYDYMMVGEERFETVNTGGNSEFEIPVTVFDEPMAVQADTTAMSAPHLIDYTLTFHSDSIEELK